MVSMAGALGFPRQSLQRTGSAGQVNPSWNVVMLEWNIWATVYEVAPEQEKRKPEGWMSSPEIEMEAKQRNYAKSGRR